ncbi:TPA: hypothetical protein ACMHIG_001761 [Neisseria lactamica]
MPPEPPGGISYSPLPLQTASSVRLCRFGGRFLLNAKYPVIPAQAGIQVRWVSVISDKFLQL